jgi:hypothetical protein
MSFALRSYRARALHSVRLIMMLRPGNNKGRAPLAPIDPNAARKKAKNDASSQQDFDHPYGFSAKEIFEHVDDFGTTQDDLDAFEEFDLEGAENQGDPFEEQYGYGFLPEPDHFDTTAAPVEQVAEIQPAPVCAPSKVVKIYTHNVPASLLITGPKAFNRWFDAKMDAIVHLDTDDVFEDYLKQRVMIGKTVPGIEHLLDMTHAQRNTCMIVFSRELRQTQKSYRRRVR